MRLTLPFQDELSEGDVDDMLHVMASFLPEREPGEPWEVIDLWSRLGGRLWVRGRFLSCLECDALALSAAERISDLEPEKGKILSAVIRADLAYDCLELRELGRAYEHACLALELYESLGDPEEVANIERYQANILCLQGKSKFREAETLLLDALERLDRVEHKREHSRAWQLRMNLGERLPHRVKGFVPQRGEFASTPEGRRLGMRASVHNLLGWIYAEEERTSEARDELRLALQAIRRLRLRGGWYLHLAPLQTLGRMFEEQGRASARAQDYGRSEPYFRKAEWHFEFCVLLTSNRAHLEVRAPALYGLARLLARRGKLAEALRHAEESMDLFERMDQQTEKERVLEFTEHIRGQMAGFPS